MKSIRLNKTIREAILNNIMASFDKENPAPPAPLDAQLHLNKAVVASFLEENKNTFKKIAGLEKQFTNLIEHTSYFYYTDDKENTSQVYFSSMSNTNRREDRSYIYSGDDDYVSYPDVLNGHYINLSNPDTVIPDIIQKALDEIKAEKKNIKEMKKAISIHESERQQYRATVEHTLNGVNTTGQLNELWPEVVKFYPQGLVNPSTINLPSVNIAQLNSKLGK